MPVEVQVTFNSSMSEEDFFKWLRSKGVSDKDCKILSGKIHQYNCIVLLLLMMLIPFREWCYCSGVCSV